MGDVDFRQCESGEESSVVALWNECFAFDPIDNETMISKVILDPNFLRSGLILAIHSGSIVGFIISVVRDVSLWVGAGERDLGWITSVCVKPEFRRKGVGSRLVEQAEGFLGSKGRSSVVFSNYFPGYFLPGIDEKAYPGSLAFFESLGFSVTKVVPAMGRGLYDFVWPDSVLKKRKELLEKTVVCATLSLKVVPGVVDFLRGNFPEWSYYFWMKMMQRDPFSDVVVALKGHEVIGYCQQFKGDHIGPFGIGEKYRGCGIGTVMLCTLLERMKQKGYKYAWFGSADGESVRYYERAGFTITREHMILTKLL